MGPIAAATASAQNGTVRTRAPMCPPITGVTAASGARRRG